MSVALPPIHDDGCVIQELADSEAALLERIAGLLNDLRIYRELMCALFDALHQLTRERARDRVQHHYVQDEYRALRERLLMQAGVDA